ncbi:MULTISPECIES: IS3 family transposase [Pontibacter]|uniref:IS3 family transposase n=2 Tax=Pontibacter TaxID=323449 RepID=A0A5C8KDH0_9BACT|nr:MULTISPECIES: IS3 family transposase [Pontibacter]PVY38378.1 transposase InsO family protein [Pontibacter virosus]TXK50082.1 IS3 family transposase [Pontibacter qinzhouensis]
MRVEQRRPSYAVGMLCSLFGYSRQAYYQQIKAQEQQALQEDLLLQEVLRIRQTQKRLGARKLLVMMTYFMSEHRIEMGRDAFFELLREQGLLIRKRRRSRPQTTFSSHWLRKYSNLIIGFVPVAPNQLWVSDITYIHLQSGFAYLSLITDAYSHKIVGFYLCEDLSAYGCNCALEMALRGNPIHQGLFHHSDRGLQYCSSGYVKLLQDHAVAISMTQKGDPLENALAERVNGILKEELLEVVYPTFAAAQLAIAEAISIYNFQRPHSSVDMLTPVEAHARTGALKKHWKNYYAIKKSKTGVDGTSHAGQTVGEKTISVKL